MALCLDCTRDNLDCRKEERGKRATRSSQEAEENLVRCRLAALSIRPHTLEKKRSVIALQKRDGHDRVETHTGVFSQPLKIRRADFTVEHSTICPSTPLVSLTTLWSGSYWTKIFPRGVCLIAHSMCGFGSLAS